MNFGLVSIIILSGVLTYFGIAVFRNHSLKRNWLDFPNQRSSHDRPVPRGAGLIVVPVCLIGYLLIVLTVGIHFSWGYFVGACLVAFVSWLDDLYSISFVWRLMTHLLSALIVVASDGTSSIFSLGSGGFYSFGWLGPTLAIVWIVWVINAYNFMDGIDGIAAVQGLVAAAAWTVITASTTHEIYTFPLVVFASLLGFIIHNWHPAKVFIGDVGSAFLGFTFASMPLIIGRENRADANLLPIVSILVLWPFIFDTVLTLIRRLLKGETIWRAHRQHLYQLLVISGIPQPTVTVIYGIFALVTATSAILFLKGLISSRSVIGLIALTSVSFALAVAQTFKRRSRIIQATNGT